MDKIPCKFIQFLKDNCLKDYECDFDYTKPLKELNISDEAKGLIAMICLNYWCTNDEQRERFKKHLTENELKYQEKLRKKYNPDNLFKNKVEKINVEDTIKKDNIELIEYKEPKWYQNIFDRIMNIFKKN